MGKKAKDGELKAEEVKPATAEEPKAEEANSVGNSQVEQLESALAAEKARAEQLEVQLAGCLRAATGGAMPSRSELPDLKQGDYGWSEAFERTRELRAKYELVYAHSRDLEAQLASHLSVPSPNDSKVETGEFVNYGLEEQEETAFIRESVAGLTITISVAYREFVKGVDGDFPPWNMLAGYTKQMYAESVYHVRAGNEPRTDFERTVKRLFAESPLMAKLAA